MPIQIQCCGLLLMLILLYFYKSQKTIKLNTEKAFWNSFRMTFVSIILDILSCIAIRYREFLPDIAVKLISKTYLVTLVGVSFFALLYICTDIYSRKSDYKKTMIPYGFFVLLAIALIYALPIFFYENKSESVLYSYGPSDYATYAFALGTLAMLAIRLLSQKSKISASRRQAVWIWMGVWFAAALTQFIFPNLLLVGFASALGMLVLYLKLENPGNNLDRQTGLFNHGAFLQYVNQLYSSETDFAVLSATLEKVASESIRADIDESAVLEAADYLGSLHDVFTFKNSGNEIILVFDAAKADRHIDDIFKRFKRGWGKSGGVFIAPYWVFVPHSDLADSAENLMHLIRYTRQNCAELAESHFYKIDSELAAQLNKEKEMEQLISDAIINDRLEVWYQPIYSTELRRFASAEALVRIRRENGELVPPADFIPIAESNGSILKVGETVFRKVCEFLNKSEIDKHGISYIEINLSVVQCAYEKLAEDYISIMADYGISPKLINLEITESASMNAKKTLLENMKRLTSYGVNFSLDDFGTGQSNLDYIVDMPVDIVKFDKGMTSAYFENGKAKYIMDAAMSMIQGMNLKIVSEGIETEEQFKVMNDLGINYIQGYYFSKPLSADEFMKFIIKNNN